MNSEVKICNKCGLQYSSYCVDCIHVKHGLGLTLEEYINFIKHQQEVTP